MEYNSTMNDPHYMNDIIADDLFIESDRIELTDEGLAVMAELWEEGCLHS